MSRVKTRKGLLSVGLLLMGLMIALGALGVGFGLWSKVLTITGTVETGTVNAEFSMNEVDEGAQFWEGDHPCDEDTDLNDDCEVDGKDIAECTATRIFASPDLPNPGSQLIEVTITDGYPSYDCWVQFDVHNNGSLPIKIHQPVIGSLPTGLTVDILPAGYYGPSAGKNSVCYHTTDIEPFAENTTHPQLEPSETAYCVLHIHVDQDAPQGATGTDALTFQATICAHQWNEEPGSAATCAAP